MSDWVCYLIMSLDTNETYIGSSNNQQKRLENHNKGKGAKRTKGRTWVTIVVVSGFHHKNACLSFEAGWKRLAKKRANTRLIPLNMMTGNSLAYSKDTKWNRIIDLLYFVHNVTLLDTHFCLNYDIRHPVNPPDQLILSIAMEEWICDLPWPFFVETKIGSFL
jgi:putative endonuclease